MRMDIEWVRREKPSQNEIRMGRGGPSGADPANCMGQKEGHLVTSERKLLVSQPMHVLDASEGSF